MVVVQWYSGVAADTSLAAIVKLKIMCRSRSIYRPELIRGIGLFIVCNRRYNIL